MKKTRKKEKGRVGVEIGEGRDGVKSGEKGGEKEGSGGGERGSKRRE